MASGGAVAGRVWNVGRERGHGCVGLPAPGPRACTRPHCQVALLFVESRDACLKGTRRDKGARSEWSRMLIFHSLQSSTQRRPESLHPLQLVWEAAQAGGGTAPSSCCPPPSLPTAAAVPAPSVTSKAGWEEGMRRRGGLSGVPGRGNFGSCL